MNLTSVKNKAVALKDKAAVGLLMAGASAGAFAQDTSGDGITTMTNLGVAAINSLKTNAQTYLTAAFGVVLLCSGGWWAIAMLKKSVRVAK